MISLGFDCFMPRTELKAVASFFEIILNLRACLKIDESAAIT